MRKIFSLIAAVLFAGSMMADEAVLQYTGGVTTNLEGEGVNNAATLGLDEDLFTVLADRGSNQNFPGLNQANDIRLYADRNSGNGNIITVSIASGTITSIVLDIKQTATFVVKAGETAVTEAGGAYAINAASFSIQNTTTGATTQLRLNKITITYETGEVPPTPVVEYYLVGNFNSWQADEAYKLAKNPGNAAEMMIKGVELEANDELKVIGILGETTTWYPDGQDNNYVVAADGEYDIYFRADGQGGDDWYNGYFYLAQVLVPTTCAEASAAILALADNTYLLDQRQITLRGYVTEIAVDYSEDYHNVSFWMADEANGGQVIEAFRAACATAEDAPAVGDVVEVTGKMKKYVKNNVATPEFDAGCTFTILDDIHTAINNTNADAKVVKFFENGQLLINKNGVIYNAQGAVVR